jgi:hypothetical protein
VWLLGTLLKGRVLAWVVVQILLVNDFGYCTQTTCWFPCMNGVLLFTEHFHVWPHLILPMCDWPGRLSLPWSQKAWVWIGSHCSLAGCFRGSYFTFLCLSVLICRVHITPGLLSEGSGRGGWGWDGCRLYNCAWNVVNQCSGSVPSIISIVLILEMWELRCCGLEVCVFPRFMLKPKSLMCCLYEMGVSGRYLGHEVRSPMMRSVPL